MLGVLLESGESAVTVFGGEDFGGFFLGRLKYGTRIMIAPVTKMTSEELASLNSNPRNLIELAPSAPRRTNNRTPTIAKIAPKAMTTYEIVGIV